MNTCYKCSNLLRAKESWEMPHIWWWECKARPAMANLKSFPFKNTKCPEFTAGKTEKRGVFHREVL